jgi:hypothetical protein
VISTLTTAFQRKVLDAKTDRRSATAGHSSDWNALPDPGSRDHSAPTVTVIGNVSCPGEAMLRHKTGTPVEVEYVFNWRLRQPGSGEQTVSRDKMTFQEAMAIDRFAVLLPESGQKRFRDDVQGEGTPPPATRT